MNFKTAQRLPFILLIVFLLLKEKVNGQVPLSDTKVASPSTTQSIYKPGGYDLGIRLNYICTREPQVPYTLESDVVSPDRTVDQVHHTTQYSDGLGRPLQTVSWQSSPTKADIVNAIVYDDFGREQYKFLPYTSPSASGNFKDNPFDEQSRFYGTTYVNEQKAYTNEKIYHSKSIFEASPLNRLTASFAPGNSWAGTEGSASESERTVKMQYLTNAVNDDVKIWTIDFNTTIANNTNKPVASTSYSAGELYKNVTTDEHSNQIIEYKDKEGHVILKKVQSGAVTATAPYANWLSTYYVYDDLGQLRFVIPPKAVAKMIASNSWVLAQDVVDELCFRYEYDARQRMIAKKVPGADWVVMVYDKRDRLVFTQDGNMRTKNQWMTTLYDDLNRPVQTGIAVYTVTGPTFSATRDNLQNALNTLAVSSGATNTTVTNVSGIATDLIVSSREANNTLYQASNSIVFQDGFASEPTATFTAQIVTAANTTSGIFQTINTNPTSITGMSSYVPLTITNYDDYSNTGKNYDVTNNSKLDQGSALYANPLPNAKSTMLRGMVTSTRVRVLEDPNNLATGKWMETATFYDDKGRAVQVQGDNYKGGIDIVTSRYDFVGKVVCSYSVHNNPSGNVANLRVKTNMDYDHMGRLKETRKQINDDNTKTRIVLHLDYDALGQLKTKKLGQQTDVNTSLPVSGSFLENQDYAYNIRGWLKGINWNYGAASGPTTSQVSIASNKWFSMDLSYDWGFSSSFNQYNGNISGMRWKTSGDGQERAYGFSYDAVHRITKASFTQNVNTTTWDVSAGIDFTMQGMSYDENGNIKTIQQNGMKITSSGITSPTIDNLIYTYSGINQITNKLLAVNDNSANGTVDSKLGDFTDKNTALDDYAYDVNGNLTSDKNKKITGMIYNHLNLPYQISVNKDDNTSKGTITYVYDATGNKLEKRTSELASSSNNNTAKQTYTTYIGSLVYENNVLQFFGQEEGRTRPKKDATGALLDYVYDYFLKDHLGNVRMVLTDEHKQDIYPAATLEGSAVTDGSPNALYVEKNYYSINTANIADKPINITSTNQDYHNNNTGIPNNNPNSNAAATSIKMYKLNGTTPQTGLGITLKVMAGDKIDIAGESYYLQNNTSGSNNSIPVNDIFMGLLGSSTGATASKGATLSTLTGTNPTIIPTSFLTRTPVTGDVTPNAYINYIFFNEQFKYVSGNFSKVGGNGSVKYHYTELQNISVPKNGFVYIYVSNQSPVDVYFDNVQVVQTRGPLLEETHYYPFGLTMSGISSKAAGGIENRKNKFQNQEFNNDLGVDVYEFKYRMHDPQTGRFWQIDPMASKYVGNSQYAFSENRVIDGVDMEGLEWAKVTDGSQTTGYIWDPANAYVTGTNTLKDGYYRTAIYFTDNGTFDDGSEFNMGSSTATVYRTDGTTENFDATIYPARLNEFPSMPEGDYTAALGQHQGKYTALHLTNTGDYANSTINLGFPNPNVNSENYNTNISTGVHIHHAGQGNKTGRTRNGKNVSEGCLLVDINNWDDFIANFTGGKSSSRSPTSVTISRSSAASKKLSVINVPYYSSSPTVTRYNSSTHQYEELSDAEENDFFQRMLNRSSERSAEKAPAH
ncbi:MAG: cell well associated RhsD protein [Segetibacter sp.]|nr:cell well associated RhsD protein [Segetibacter sp.]